MLKSNSQRKVPSEDPCDAIVPEVMAEANILQVASHELVEYLENRQLFSVNCILELPAQ